MLFTTLCLLDLLTTYAFGMECEANPIVQDILVQYGFLGFVLGKALLVAYFVISAKIMDYVYRPGARIYRAIMCGIGATVVLWNIRFLILIGR